MALVNLETWYFSVGLNRESPLGSSSSVGRSFYLFLESSNKENWNIARDPELSRNRGTFAKVLAYSLKTNLGRKWEKLPSSNERWTDKSIPDWFWNASKKKKKKKGFQPLNCWKTCALMEYLRNNWQVFEKPSCTFDLPNYTGIFSVTFPYDRSMKKWHSFVQTSTHGVTLFWAGNNFTPLN